MFTMFRRTLDFLYERYLERSVLQQKMPKHVGIILDGNRRYAQEAGLLGIQDVYRLGAEKIHEVLEWSAELDISVVTLWVLSTDNLRRPPSEVSHIFAALEAKFLALAEAPDIHNRKVRVRASGRLELLPASTSAAIRAAEAATKNYDAMSINIAVAYGGREEITDAIRSLLAEKAKSGCSLTEIIDQVTPDEIAKHLYAPGVPDPDLIIRTSGEIRLSGFLLWQSAYSEFYFTDVYWPAFRKVDFLRAIRSYQQRKRRLGT